MTIGNHQLGAFIEVLENLERKIPVEGCSVSVRLGGSGRGRQRPLLIEWSYDSMAGRFHGAADRGLRIAINQQELRLAKVDLIEIVDMRIMEATRGRFPVREDRG